IWQIQDGALNAVFFASILTIVITLFEQAIPMTNVAFYNSDTTRSLKNIEEVINQNFENRESYETSNNTLYYAEKLNFKYDFQERNTLNNVQFKINEGEHVAIIGAAVSSKSTLLSLLMGLYSSNEGLLAYKGKAL